MVRGKALMAICVYSCVDLGSRSVGASLTQQQLLFTPEWSSEREAGERCTAQHLGRRCYRLARGAQAGQDSICCHMYLRCKGC